MTSQEALLTTLRNPQTKPPLFRKTTTSLASLLAQEHRCISPTVLVPILRAGLALLPPFTSTFPNASIGILGIKRDENTALPHKYYEKLPTLSTTDLIFILDPMIATGGTARLAIKALLERGASPENITLISVIASEEGIRSVQHDYPQVVLHIVATDPALSDKKMIVPGLGDFGDRYFGTV